MTDEKCRQNERSSGRAFCLVATLRSATTSLILGYLLFEMRLKLPLQSKRLGPQIVIANLWIERTGMEQTNQSLKIKGQRLNFQSVTSFPVCDALKR